MIEVWDAAYISHKYQTATDYEFDDHLNLIVLDEKVNTLAVFRSNFWTNVTIVKEETK